MTPEGKVKDKVKKMLAEYPGLYYEMPVPGGYGKSGLDFSGCYKRLAFYIETKAPGQKPTERQESVMRQMRASGATVFVVTGNDPHSYATLRMWLDAVKGFP